MCQKKIKLCEQCIDDECRKCRKNSHYLPDKNLCECDQGYIYNSILDVCVKEVICKTEDFRLCNNCHQGICTQCKNQSSLIKKKCECNKGFMYNFANDYCYKNGIIVI